MWSLIGFFRKLLFTQWNNHAVSRDYSVSWVQLNKHSSYENLKFLKVFCQVTVEIS